MALVPIKFNPGIEAEPTVTQNETGWSASENIRFFQGFAQKSGGFSAFSQTLAGAGIPRALQAWQAISGIAFLAIGCGSQLNIFSSEAVSNITPLTISSTVPINLTTQIGTQTVTVTDFINTPSVGEWLQIRDPVSVGGISLVGSYVITATGVNSYTFMAATVATQSINHGGNVRQFSTNPGSTTVQVYLPGHGLFTGQTVSIPDLTVVGGINLQGNYIANVVSPDVYNFTVLTPATISATVFENNGNIQLTFFNPPSGGSQVSMNVQSWTLANWGEFLMACPMGGPVYVWMPANGTRIPAAAINTAPQSSLAIFVATQQEILFCLGTVNPSTGLVDPLLLAWSDAGDYTDFIPSLTNQAGSFRLSIGSRIVGGIALAGGAIIWTDLAAYWAQYLGPPLVWGFQPFGVNYGLVGPHAFGTLGQQVFWMSQNQFVYSPGGTGPPQIIPCKVWDLVFKNIDRSNIGFVVCETNSYFNEVAWEVPQLDGTVTRARVQVDTGLWDYTILPSGSSQARTAWTDQSVFGPPLGADQSGRIWQHEVGTDAGGAPLPWLLRSGVAQIAEGDDITFFREVIPDFKFSETGEPGPGTVMMKIYVWNRSQDPPFVKGPYPITSQTRSVPVRGRGRGLQFEFSGNDLGSWVRLGDIRYRGAIDGRQ